MPKEINVNEMLKSTPAVRSAIATEELSEEIKALSKSLDTAQRNNLQLSNLNRRLALITMIFAALSLISSVVFGILSVR